MKKQLKKTGKSLTKPVSKPVSKGAPAKPLSKRPGKSLTKKEAVVVTQSAQSHKPNPEQRPLKKAEPPKPKSGPMPVVPKGFKFKGTKSRFNGVSYLLVDAKDMPKGFPRLHKQCVPDSFYRVNPKTNAVDCIMTLLPKSKGRSQVRTSWANCVGCDNHFLRCICKDGLIHPRGVEWVYIRAVMERDGLNTRTSEPIIDSTSLPVTDRAVHHYLSKSRGETPLGAPYRTRDWSKGTDPQSTAAKPSKPLRKAGSKSLTKGGAKPLAKSTPPTHKSLGKGLKRGTKPPVEQVDVSNLDLTELGKDAAKSADALADSLAKSLAKTPAKSLKKRGK